MRIGRVLAGIIVIAVVLFAILWLNNHGYFNKAAVSRTGAMRNEPPPEPADVPVDTNTPSRPVRGSATAQPVGDPDKQYAAIKSQAEATYQKEIDAENRGELPIGTARADFESTLRKAQADRDAAKRVIAANAAAAAKLAPATVPPPPPAKGSAAMQPMQTAGKTVTPDGMVCYPAKPRVRSVTRRTTRRRLYVPPEPLPQVETSYTPPAPRAQLCNLLGTSATGAHQVELPTGLLLRASLDRMLSTRVSAPGDTFTGYLVGPVTYCGHVVIPAGSAVQGSVAVSRRRGVTEEGASVLELHISSIQANGYNFSISGASITREERNASPYEPVEYDANGMAIATVRQEGRNVEYPASSVVSFWLQNGAPVIF